MISISTIPTKQTSSFSSLNQYIQNSTDQICWGRRIWKSIKMIYQKDALTGLAAISSIAIANIYTFTCSYLLLKGSYLSLKETYTVLKVDSHLVHEPGDAGGWVALAIFSILALSTATFQCIKEGEYLNLKSLFQQWHQKMVDSKTNINQKELYSKLEEIIDAISSEGALPKSTIDRKVYAWDILKTLTERDIEEKATDYFSSELDLDKKLQLTYQDIQKELNSSLSIRNYFSRLKIGLKAIKAYYGTSAQYIAIINGTILPALLILNACLSACGEIILAKEVLFKKKEPLLTGHVGEWPVNLVEALFAAVYLNMRFILNEGDFILSKNIFCQFIQHLQLKENENGNNNEIENKKLYNHLCGVANTELQRLAANCSFSKIFLEYKFEKIMEER